MVVNCHYGMVATNWAAHSKTFASGNFGFWLLIVIQWISFILYMVS